MDKSYDKKLQVSVSISIFLSAILNGASVLAQPIIPAHDGTGTLVTPNGARFDIHGGQRSSDGRNLFQSFDRFGLGEGQTANFLADPNLTNILGRVTGGEASFINGLLQVSGGDANLFLVNPAGIVFGPSAALNVPADFTATTATGIGLGNDRFDIFGDNRWGDLVGTPDRFEFAVAHPGAIVNAGHLAVNARHNLSLLAGTLVNTGTLQARGGNITLAAVPGESWVRLSAGGNVLSLEVEPTSNRAFLNFTPLSLPQLLAGGQEWGHATSIALNPDGTLSLVGSETPIAPHTGDAIVSGTVDVSNASDSLPVFSPATLQILGTRIGLFDATLDASSINGGGNIFIGGDFQGTGTLPNAQYTFVDAGTSIFADALQQGDGGRVILWADDTTQFFGNISARGTALSTSDILSPLLPFPNSNLPFPNSELRTPNSNGGFVEISGKQNLVFSGQVDTRAPHGNLGILLLDPENITIADGNGDGAGDGTDFFAGGGNGGQILAGDTAPVTVYESELEALQGNTNIILEATNDITIEDLNDNQLTLSPGGGSVVFRADSDGVDGGSFSMNPDDSIVAQGRDVSISGASLALGSVDTSAPDGDGGNITLRSSGGDIATDNVLAFSEGAGTAGNITIEIPNGSGTIDTRRGTLRSSSTSGRAGNITLRTHNGNILTNRIRTDSDGTEPGGNIRFEISGTGSIDTEGGDLGSDSISGDGGNIALITRSGNITTADIFSFSDGTGAGGNISLTVREGEGRIEVGDVFANAQTGNGGTIDLMAAGNLTTGNLQSSAGTNGGAISLVSRNGSINTNGGILNAIGGENGGDILLDSAQNITIGGIGDAALLNPGFNRNSGNIDLLSHQGAIEITGPLLTLSALGRGGNVTLDADRDLVLNKVDSRSLRDRGGEIEIYSGGNIELGEALETNQNNITFNAPIILKDEIAISSFQSGNIYFNSTINGAQNLTLNSNSGNIQALGSIGSNTPLASLNLQSNLNNGSSSIDITTTGNITARNLTSQAGIDLVSQNGNITADILNTSSAGNGGNITLSASNILLDRINAQSQNGAGGNVNIDVENFLRVTDSFLDRNSINSSISTAGATNGGTIVIRHGGDGVIPFIVGNAAQNGTTGAITRGNGNLETIASGTFPYTYTQDAGRIQIISVPAPIESEQMESNSGEMSDIGVSPNPDEIDPDAMDNSEMDGSDGEESLDEIDPTEGDADAISEPGGDSDSTLDGESGENSIDRGNGIDNPNPSDGEDAIVNPSPMNEGDEANLPVPNGGEGGQDAIANPNPMDGNNGIDTPNPMDATNINSPNPMDGGNDLDSNPDRTSDVISERDLTSDSDPREELAQEIADDLDADLLWRQEDDRFDATWTLPDPKQDISLKLEIGNLEGGVAAIDRFFEEQIEEAAGENLNEDEREISAQVVRETLKTIELETGKRGAIVYALTLPQSQAFHTPSAQPHDRHREQLTLVLVVPEGSPIVKTVDLELGQLQETLDSLRENLQKRYSQSYLPDSQQLYRWLVRPLDEELEALDIDTLIFSMDAGLRQLPLAVLHDGERFLVERYSLGSIPSLSLTDTRYEHLQEMQVLAMGASEFPQSDKRSLPNVPTELSIVSGNSPPISNSTQAVQEPEEPPEKPSFDRTRSGLWFLNEEFTLENLIEQRQKQPFDIIHLATHANFDRQNRDRAYIELWNHRLSLDELRKVKWYAPPIVELLVLSACETAVGNLEAELGFAGLAVRSGVKSVLASLWQVDDLGTLVVMSQFYEYLQEAPIKAEALRQAQLALLRGEVGVRDGYLIGHGMQIPLSPEVGDRGDRDFSHPSYWSGFTMVGSPW